MKRPLTFLLLLAVTGLGFALTACGPEEPVVSLEDAVPDRKFRACLNEDHLDREASLPITAAQLEGISGGVECRNRGIHSIEGAQYLTGVASLDLNSNWISDLTPLANLTKIARMHLMDNQISDLTPLSGFTDLTLLILESNRVSDLTPLANLTKLKMLRLDNNRIGDLSPIAELDLTTLTAREQRVTASAVVGTALPLPEVIGPQELSWDVRGRGGATITGETVTYEVARTVVLGFTDKDCFSGYVYVTVT